jgi:signal transduction histidine kinase
MPDDVGPVGQASTYPERGLLGRLSLRARLSLLVLASLLPMLLFSLVSQYLQYRNDVAELQERSKALAHSIGLTIEQMLVTRIAALEVLARSRALRDGDLEAFRSQALALVEQQFPAAHLLLLDETGRQYMHTAVGPGETLPARLEMTSTRKVFETGRPQVSNLFFGRVRNTPVVAIDVPVKREDGRVFRVLSMNPRLHLFAEAIARERIPRDWIVSILDGNAVNVARTVNHERYLGQAASDKLTAAMKARPEGTYEGISREGIPVFTAFSRIEPFGWSVAMGIPRAELQAPALQAAAWTLLGGVVLLGASLGIAFMVARQITQPISALRLFAATTTGAEPNRRSSTGLRETDEVAEVLQRSEASRHRANAALQQASKMEAIGNLTGGLAHDFNNLLGVVIGNLDLARPLLDKNSEAAELVEESLTAAISGAELTKRLLAFARRQPLQPQSLDVNRVVDGVMKLLNRTLGEAVETELNLAPGAWPVIADRSQLEAALLNLAANARDAMPAGGRLTVTTANRPLDADYAARHPEVSPGDYLMLEVSDTGTGMPPEVMARIFEPFYTTKARGTGTGLGLAMVFGFVRQSGGHVTVDSQPGAGTTFRLYLPRAATEDAPAPSPGAAPLPRAAGETVLVVEDNVALRRVASRQLRELGYSVLQAESGSEALAILEQRRVDLVFSDVVIPGGVNGIELARIVQRRWPDTRIALTSGFSEATVHGDPEAIGVRLLTKPYRRAELAQMLREVMSGRSSGVAGAE